MACRLCRSTGVQVTCECAGRMGAGSVICGAAHWAAAGNCSGAFRGAGAGEVRVGHRVGEPRAAGSAGSVQRRGERDVVPGHPPHKQPHVQGYRLHEERGRCLARRFDGRQGAAPQP